MRPALAGIGAFLVAALLAALAIGWLDERQIEHRRTEIAEEASDRAHEIENNVERALSATYALAALVRQGRGTIPDFDPVAAEMLPFYPGADSLQLAPGGVVRHIVPLRGNERAIGHDLLADRTRTKEAFLARDTGKLTLAGPFELLQGGLGAVGRLPVFLDGPDNQPRFWGFTSVLLRFPKVLAAAQMEQLPRRGLHYELWRIHPDTGEKQVITRSDGDPMQHPVTRHLNMPNGVWSLSVEPLQGWRDTQRLALMVAIGLLFSLMAAWLAKQMTELRVHRTALQVLVAQRTADLAAREADLQRAQTIAHTGSWIFADDRLSCSAEACRIYGIADGTVLDRRGFLDRVHPQDQRVVDVAWRAAIEDGTPYDLEHRIVVGGELHWVREQAEIVRDEHGLLVRAVGTVQEITDRRRADELLRRLSAAVEQSPASIVITDPAGTIEYVNPQFERASGYGADEAIGQNPRILKSGRTPPEEYELLWATISAGRVWRGEFHNKRKDGSLYWESASISPIQAPDGSISGYVAVKEDVTQQRQAEQRIHEQDRLNRAMLDLSFQFMGLLDPAGRLLRVNRTALDTVGAREDEVIGRPIWECPWSAHDAGEQQRLRAAVERAAHGESHRFEAAHRLADGGLALMDVSVRPVFDENGQVIYIIPEGRDITERRRAEARMREAMVVFEASSQGILTTDAQGVILSVNPAMCAITGYGADELLGRTPAVFKSGRHDAAFYEAMWSGLHSHGRWEGEVWNRRKGGELYPEWLTITAVRDEQGAVVKYVALSSDITRRKEREEIIWRQANFDELTGLANRHLLHDRLQRTLAQSRRNGKHAGLVFLDLDGFKWINDTLGHDVGDELLVVVAERLQACIREQDTVARMGGDEFTLVVGDLLDPRDLRLIGEKVLRALDQPIVLAGAAHRISASLGMTVYPDDGEDVQALFRNADIAMYEAKQLGKNRFEFYARHMRERAQLRMQLEAELRKAIQDGAFELHYQPIVEAATGRLSGAEALIRWRHPQRGLVSPIEFIPVAEETGLIVPIGEWVLREAARQSQSWREQGYPPLRIAVNISGVQYREAGLPELIARIHADHGLESAKLMLEITESVLMEGSDVTEARMRAIKAQGVGYSLDDFGTGFSSLSYLKRFPVDVVKIDRSFVHDCRRSASDARLVEAIINMAHSLDLRVTAEGVETDAQLEFLRSLGCDYLQGYIISRPLPASDFETLFRHSGLLPSADA